MTNMTKAEKSEKVKYNPRVELADRVYMQDRPEGFEAIPLQEHVLKCVTCKKPYVFVSIIGKKKLEQLLEDGKKFLHTCIPCERKARLSPEVQRLLAAKGVAL